MSELKPCPFCESTDLLVEQESGRDVWIVVCCDSEGTITDAHCGAQGGSHALTREGAILLWNRRPVNPLRAALEKIANGRWTGSDGKSYVAADWDENSMATKTARVALKGESHGEG